jgi:branched-chain amino acid transport system permease protein
MTIDILIQGLSSGLLLGFVFALISMGLSLIWGMMEIVNFAYGEFLMIGMYTSYWMNILWDVDPFFSVPISGVIMFFVGAITHKLVIRRILGRPMLVQILATFGISMFLSSLVMFFFTSDYLLITNKILTGRFEIFGAFISTEKFATGIVSIVVCLFMYWLISKTEFGKVLQAVTEDKEVSALMGINSEKMYTLAWGMSGACAGIAGAALSSYFYIYPTVGSVFSLTAFVAVALGGFGSISGSILGGIIIGLIQTFSGLLFDPIYKMVAVFGVYFIVLMIKPRGLFGRY